MKHSGSLDDLKTIVEACGFSIDQVLDQEHSKQIRTKQSAIINWFPSTGTVSVQGNKDAKQRFTAAWDSYSGVPRQPPRAYQHQFTHLIPTQHQRRSLWFTDTTLLPANS